MRRPVFVRASARLLLAALLCAQGMLAFAGCDIVERSPAQAAAASDAPCHEPVGEANLCIAHCRAEALSVDKPVFFMPLLGAAPVSASRVALQRARSMRLPTIGIPPQAAAPPRILFRSLLI